MEARPEEKEKAHRAEIEKMEDRIDERSAKLIHRLEKKEKAQRAEMHKFE